jgi:antitoxin ChpS
MHLTKLRAVGGSVMFAIPKALLDSLHLQANASVGVSIVDGKLIVDPQAKRRYVLADLMKQCDLTASCTAEDEAWLNDAAVGEEQI